jgi:ribosome maturation factor RimP
MPFAFDKLPGLDKNRLLSAVEPVLAMHGVTGVELVWRGGRGHSVLEVTIERPHSRIPGAGITIQLCSEISRDLGVALDVADAIPSSYSLEVGSPGLDRALYSPEDYQRFAGERARIKLRQPIENQYVIWASLQGLDDQGRAVLKTEGGEFALEFAQIESARLAFEWNTPSGPRARHGKTVKQRTTDRGQKDRRPLRRNR